MVLKCSILPYLKSDSHLPKNCFIYFDESPLKMIKKRFLFHLKSFYRSQDVAIHNTLATIHLRSKGNQTMKFGQIIEHKKIFFFKYHAKYEGGRLVPELFLFLRKKR